MSRKKKDLVKLYQENMNFINEYYKKQDEYNRSTKFSLIILGEKSVGKTSIISTFQSKSFDPNIESTRGAKYSEISYIIGKFDEYFGYSTWDTGGDKIYRPLLKHFMEKKQVFILVYDITKRETFNELREYWINEIKKHITSKSGKFLYIFILFYNYSYCNCRK